MCRSSALAALAFLALSAPLAVCGGTVVTPTRQLAAPVTPPHAAEPAGQPTPPAPSATATAMASATPLTPVTPPPSPSPTAARSPAPGATPRRGKVPPPTPDPAAVAAGGPLRATLLAQLDEFEREVCPMRPPSLRPCGLQGSQEEAARFPELAAYRAWFEMVEQCHYYEGSPTGYLFTLVGLSPTPAQLREPWRLDVYVSGADWCGVRTPRGTPTR